MSFCVEFEIIRDIMMERSISEENIFDSKLCIADPSDDANNFGFERSNSFLNNNEMEQTLEITQEEMIEAQHQELPSPLLKPIGHERRKAFAKSFVFNNESAFTKSSHDQLNCDDLIFKFDPITVKGIYMQEVKELNHRIKQTQILWAEKPSEKKRDDYNDDDNEEESSAFDRDVQESLLDFLAEESEVSMCKRQRTC